MPADDWDYQVRHRAYELWNAAGRPNGKHQEFWEAAERELKPVARCQGESASGADVPNGLPRDEAAKDK